MLNIVLILCGIIALMVSTMLEFVSLWQIEICARNVADRKMLFEFPFYAGGEVDVWLARDFWYAVNVATWIVGMSATYITIIGLGFSFTP